MTTSRQSLSFLRPRNARQWVLGVLIAVIAVAGIGSYAYVNFSSDSLFTNSSTTWNGGTLVLRSVNVGSGRCTVQPEQGERRELDVVGGGLDRTVVEPWFEGTAEVSCGHRVSVWTGAKASLASVVLSFGGFMGFAIGLGVLIVIYVTAGPPPARRSTPST